MRPSQVLLLAAALFAPLAVAGQAAAQSGAVTPAASAPSQQDAARTATPIKHLVVIFQENVSFDHYFATYPNAANPPGEPAFSAAPGTPEVNNLAKANLLTNNPNLQGDRSDSIL